ncbi:glycosyltransferase family 2 protein [Polynucleobacter sp. AP-Sanab-80-C2]|uniref:glycosyltransferase family 2 protein n=1 Tax=Polynucleobacter sp. AP-Sanab-80-C2 TaxID=3108274 RepID=UPI002B224E9E|nr:glycosyltransferase family 2 protein [Polynucleobacter sp. AP-Sanab-80-C2]MEA9598556.1 glycosyltransferase family 2 protein [Polynucleobacter sp. AP-Sanab-80-C2]
MFNQDIKISIGLVTYNRISLLKEAINSILDQEYKNIEVIISNDYVEEPLSLIDLGIISDNRFRLVNQRTNLGELENMNYVLKQATGDWFTWLGDDDLFHPRFLITMRSILANKNTSYLSAIYTDYFTGNQTPISWSANEDVNCSSFDQLTFPLVYTGREIKMIGCYGLIRTKALKLIGGMPCLGSSFGPYGDTLVPLLLSQCGQIIYCHSKLLFLRTHPGSLSCSTTDLQAYRTASKDFLSRIDFLYQAPSFPRVLVNKVTLNMLTWFSVDEWAILSRNPSVKLFEKISIFTRNLRVVNFPKLNTVNKVVYLSFLVKMTIRSSLKLLIQGLRKLVSHISGGSRWSL